MFPRINNKTFMECTLEDFHELIDNPDYRENQYLDYKKTFSFLGVHKDIVAEKNAEFRKDICSFANADGGYILYGISEKQAIASELIGVEIDNPDKFELEIRNKLISIMPKIPSIQFRFVPMGNRRYLVVAYIEHDYYAPYIYIENEKDYRIYKRAGNRSPAISYTELKNMFVQSRVLEEEVWKFRKKRIDYYKELGNKKYERFMLCHIIPESFLSDRKSLFLMEQKNI